MKLVCFSSSPSSPFSIICLPIPNLFMQDPKSSNTRTKPWYQKAMEVGSLWRTISNKSTTTTTTTTTTNDTISTLTIWKTISKTTTEMLSSGNGGTTPNSNNNNRQNKLRKCSSLKVATSLTRVCLCAPISSYNEVFRAEMNIPPRRSNSYPRSSSSNNSSNKLSSSSSSGGHHHHHDHSHHQPRVSSSGRHSLEGRRMIFRGKSLSEDVLMRRFVVDEEASMLQLRRRNQMEVIRRGNLMRRNKLGPSPLRRMVMASTTTTHH